MSSRVQLLTVRVSLLSTILTIFGVGLADAQTLPSPWIAADVGNPSPAGSTSFNQGIFTITASGNRISGRSDQFHFVYQQVSGDVDVLARVDSILRVDSLSTAGVMIRDSLAAESIHVSALVSAGRGVFLQRRLTTAGTSGRRFGAGVTAPHWVRLVRKGTTVAAYSSANGSSWTTIATATIGLKAAVYVGLAVTSENVGTSTTAKLSQAGVFPLSLPLTQKSQDIGAPAISGSVSYSQGTYSVVAGGSDIWDTSDQFHFVYQPVQGDVEVVARVASIGASDMWAKAGVMIRESLAANSRHASAFLTPGYGYAFQRRADTGAFSDHTGAAGTLPGWVKLVRSGSRLEGFRSSDGSSWASIGWDTIPMAAPVFVGIAVTSHNTAQPTTAVLSNFRVTQSSGSPNQPPTITLDAPTSGSSFNAPATINLTASASDPEDRLQRVEFFSGTTRVGTDSTPPFAMTWSAVPAGSYSMMAKAFDADGGSTTTPAVTVDVTSGNQLPTVNLTAPANGTSYVAPASMTVNATASDPEGPVAKVEFYSGSVLLGTDTSAPYSLAWSAVPAGSYTLKAVAYDGAGANRASGLVTVTVTAPTPQIPKWVLFRASNDHASVTKYVLEIFASNINPTTGFPVVSSDIGKPAPDANGEIRVDRLSLFTALAAGNYVATVTAVGSSGEGQSTPTSFVR